MADLRLLLLVLLGLWAWEGWVRLPRGAWCFRRRGRTWEAGGTEGLLHTGPWAWAWLPPGLRRPRLLTAQGLPLSPGSGGLWLHASQAPNPGARPPAEGAVLAWAQVPGLRTGSHQLLHEGRPQGAVQGPGLPARLRTELAALADLPAEARPRALDAWVAGHLDPAPARRRLRRLARLTQDLRLGLPLYALWLFGMLPLLVWRRGWEEAWPWLLAGTLAQQLLLACLARRAHARLLPGSEDHVAWVLGCALSPPALLRSADQLGARATADLHPAALGAALLEGEALQAFLARLVRDLRHPCLPLAEEPPPLLLDLDQEHRRRLLAQLEHRFPGLHDRAALPPPASGAEAWCPRCETPYLRPEGNCDDCGVPLQRHPESP